jgi:hypothetical protein
MKARLELQQPAEHLWLVIENDADVNAWLDAIEVIVLWRSFQRSGAPQPLSRRFKPREEFRLEVTHFIRNAVQEGFPKLPNGEQVEVIVQLLAGEEGAVPSASFRVRLKDGRLSM